MDANIYLVAVLILASIAVLDLVVGVSNDAVNFLNSSIGSRVAPRYIILIIASLGIIAGVLFSSGMMEVARKGIFHPQFFTMPELIMLFMGVMIADILVLDLFNTYGLPTSTTVSIVFELLGAAVALSVIKILSNGESLLLLDQYINTGKALIIIGGILLSVVVAFAFGAVIQFFGRLLFSFNYQRNLNKFGGFWGGPSIAAISLFILFKGAKGATFISPETSSYIKSNWDQIFLTIFVVGGITFQLLVSVFKVNVLKPIVLIGTFSLALAFAANDLVNFVGVPIAGFHAYTAAYATSDPLGVSMGMLEGKVPSSNWLLFACGAIMVLALWISRKARTVTDTEINLSSHDEEEEQFESIALSRAIVRSFSVVFDFIRSITPRKIRKGIRSRYDRNALEVQSSDQAVPSFDLLRASTNLMVASIVVSLATSYKLPLSTTYVTFMVAMGTSFADQAWGRETAVYRVTGVLTVIGGWFMTAFLAFSSAALFCTFIYFAQSPGVVILLILAAFVLWKTYGTHKEREQTKQQQTIYNLRKVTNPEDTVKRTFEQTAWFVKHIRENLHGSLEELFNENRVALKRHYRKRKDIRRWSNVIAANIFKAMRLLHKEHLLEEEEYPRTINCLQSLADSYRDTVRRAYSHLSENHKRLLSIQISELREIEERSNLLLQEIEQHLFGNGSKSVEQLRKEYSKIEVLIEEYSVLQNSRIHNLSSKTRLSILYYAFSGNILNINQQCLKLLEIFNSSFKQTEEVKLQAAK